MAIDLAVRAEGLSKTFKKGDVKALVDFDLEVPVGQVVGLLGPNGAGKTTAVRVLSTITRPDQATRRSWATTSSSKPPRCAGPSGLQASTPPWMSS